MLRRQTYIATISSLLQLTHVYLQLIRQYCGLRRGPQFGSTTTCGQFAPLGVQSRSVVESAMLMLHCGRPYGTDSSRQRQDHARRPSCDTAIEGFDPRARQPLTAAASILAGVRVRYYRNRAQAPREERGYVSGACDGTRRDCARTRLPD